MMNHKTNVSSLDNNNNKKVTIKQGKETEDTGQEKINPHLNKVSIS